MPVLYPVPHIESAKGEFRARHRTSHRPSWLRGWLDALIARWTTSGNIRATHVALDEMSEGQLEDIGMRRVSRDVRWLDCRESLLRIDFEYRSTHGDQADGDPHA